MKRAGRLLFHVAYGLSPLWLAAVLAQFERRGDLTASVEKQATR